MRLPNSNHCYANRAPPDTRFAVGAQQLDGSYQRSPTLEVFSLFDTLRRIVQEVNSAENLDEALETITRRVKEVMQTNVCSIYLTDPQTGNNLLMATDGLNPDAVHHVNLEPGEGLVGMVTSRSEPVNLEDAASHPAYKYVPETGEERYHGFLGVPIIHHRKVLGVVVVQQLTSRRFDENDETLLVTIAAQLAGAIAHAQAIGEIDKLQNQAVNDNRPFRGLPGAPGVATGTALVVYPSADLDAVPNRRCKDIEAEIKVFHAAVMAVRSEIGEIKEQVTHLPEEDQAIFDAYLMMLRSNSLIKKTEERIHQGFMASTALRDTVREQIHVFESMSDDYLADRAQDIKDLGRRILMHIQSKKPGPRVYPNRTILVGEELSASTLMEVPKDQLAGVLCASGSSSSHVTILAKAMGIPAVMGASDLPIGKVENHHLILDGYQGIVYVNPSKTVQNEYARLIKEEAELSSNLATLKELPAETPDGHQIPLYVNSGLLSDLNNFVDSGAQGIGLYRTEFPFMIRDRFPGEEEQLHIYRQILQDMAPKPVVLRTLDIGGDKNIPYFPIKEDNPFLGWRGIRISLDHPEIFVTQLRAMMRASDGLDNLHILLPMISSVSEVQDAGQLIRRTHADLVSEGFDQIPMPRVGAMIEVPSAVYQTRSIAKHVDYLSIGTNDLVQYLLAVDRNNPNVAALYNNLHPAVIEAVHHVITTGQQHGVPVSVCGEMAGDPAAAILLLGMGIDSLSMSVIALPRIKWVIRSVTQKKAKQLLQQALTLDDPKEIRQLLVDELDKQGLGGLIRPGKH